MFDILVTMIDYWLIKFY